MLIRNPHIALIHNAHDLHEYNIKDVKRQLLIFIDKKELTNPPLLYGNAIQINISTQAGMLDSEIFAVGVNTRNNATIKMNMYCYSVIFDPLLGLKNLAGANFILQNAFSTENVEDYDTKMTSRPLIGVYDKGFSSDQERVLNVRDIFYNTSALPLPIYYTMEHQRRVEKEEASIIWYDIPIEYEGHDLIDQNTVIKVLDRSMWDSMKRNPMESVYQYIARDYFNEFDAIQSHNIFSGLNKQEGSNDIINDMFVFSTTPIINGYVFMYETMPGTIDGCKTKWEARPGQEHLPMMEYRQMEQVKADMKEIDTQLRNKAILLEKEYGPVRINYVTNLEGDHTQIEFKDYNKDNQPKTYNPSSLDKGIVSKDFLCNVYNEVVSYDEFGGIPQSMDIYYDSRSKT